MPKWATTLRRQLLALALAAMLPLLVFAAGVILWTAHISGAAARQGLENTARSLTLAVDEQVETWKAAVAALATSPSLDAGDYAAFHAQAKAITDAYGGWIAVSLPSGEQVVNTLVPFGAALPRSHPAGLPPSVLRDGSAHVSDLFAGPVAERRVLAVTVPAVRNGTVTHVLHLGIEPEDLAAVLADHRLPAGWTAGLVGGDNTIIARFPDAPHLVGERAPAWFAEAITGVEHGILQGKALDGTPVYGAFEHLPNAPWTLALAAPRAQLAQAWQRPLALLAGGGVALVAAAAAAFFALGSRLTGPMEGLAAAARAATRGAPMPPVPTSNVRELNSLRSAVIELSQKQVLLREVNHRVKNSLQLVSTTLGMQRRAAADDAARAQFRDAQAHIQAIARLHERLYQADQYDLVDACALARAVCEDIAAISARRATLRFEAEGVAHLAAKAAGPFALIVAELATNAVKHAAAAGRMAAVDISCRVEDGPEVVTVVADDGPGLPPGFDPAVQSGMGLRMCLALAAQIGGTLRTIASQRGAAFELRVPAAEAQKAS